MPSDTFKNLPFDKKNKIFSVSLNEFNNKGFEHAKITDICEKGDIKRRTFYSYFNSLEDLYEYVFEYSNIECKKLFEGNDIVKYLSENGLTEDIFYVFESYYLSVIQSEYGLRKLYEYIQELDIEERKLLNIFISAFKQYEIGVLSKDDLFIEIKDLTQ